MKVSENIIFNLLEKYYEGSTSIDDEKLLFNYFSSSNIPEKYKADQALFLELYQSPDDLNYEDFNPELLLSNAIHIAKDQEQGQSKQSFYLQSGIKRIAYWSAAASVLIIISLGILFTNKQNEKLTDTFDDPYIAMQETKRVLALLSTKLNTGQSQLDQLEKLNMASEAVEPLQEMSQNLKFLNKIEAIEKPKQLPIVKDLLFDDQD